MAKISLKQLFIDYLIQLNKEKAAIKNELHTVSDKRSVFAKECVLWHGENDGKIEAQQRQTEAIRQSISGWYLPGSVTQEKLYQLSYIKNPSDVLLQRSNYEYEIIKGFDLEEQEITRRLKEKQREIDIVSDNMNCISSLKRKNTLSGEVMSERCHKQDKVKYATMASALRRLRYERRYLCYNTCAVYKCSFCNAWHITSERERTDHRVKKYNRNQEKRKWRNKWH